MIDPHNVKQRLHNALRQGAVEGAMVIQTHAVARAPIRDSFLRASIKVSDAKTSTGHAAAVSSNKVYAPIQHESEHFNHPKGGEAKFLDKAARENLPFIKQTIANHIRGALT